MRFLPMALLLTPLLDAACQGSGKWTGGHARKPVVAVVGPTSTSFAAEVTRASQGVQLALGDGYAVVTADSRDPAAFTRLTGPQAPDSVVAIAPQPEDVALLTRLQQETSLPVVVALGGQTEGIPRVIPGPALHGRCAARILEKEEPDLLSDGSGDAILLVEAVKAKLHPVRATTFSPTDLGGAASLAASLATTPAGSAGGSRPQGTVLAVASQPAVGGDLLHLLRRTGSKRPFLGLGMYDLAFLEAAASAAEGAHVTSVDRPLLAAGGLATWAERFGEPPSRAAINAYDAGLLVREAHRHARRTAGDARVTPATVRAALTQVEAADAVGGPLRIGADGEPTTGWCTEFEVTGGTFQPFGLARIQDGQVVVVEGPRVEDPTRRTRPTATFLAPPAGLLPDPLVMPRQVLQAPDAPATP